MKLSIGMEMQINQTHQKELRDSLRSSPLKPNEFRRVEGLGGRFIATLETSVDQSSFVELMELKIDGTTYVLYSKVKASNPTN